jgi:hypothetical protein
MMSASKRLAAVGGEPVCQGVVDHSRIVEKFGTRVADQLGPLLQLKNGFYAFEAALHVLSDVGATDETGLFEWNDEALWRQEYKGMANDAVFFAEDVFGMQFCIREGTVATFDPETGAFETMAADVEQWADKVLREYDVWTGYNVAHEWQVKHGPIPAGSRLVPSTPFVLGGEYSVRNLHVIEAVKGMKYRASIAVQIRDLPDGTPITLRVIEDEETDRDPARE